MEKITERIKQRFPELSYSQKKAAHYLLENLEEVVMSSAAKVAEDSKVSEATVHRLAQQLGYTSFSEMKRDIQSFVRQDYRVINNLVSITTLKQESWLEAHFMQEAENIIKTGKELPVEEIILTAKMMLNARRVWIAGWRMSLSVTSYMQFILKYMLGTGSMVPQGETAEHAAYIQKDDVVFICAFPKYDKRTLMVAQIAKQKGAFVIGLTDSTVSPVHQYVDLTLYAKCKSKSFLDSYTAAVSICNLIISEIAYQGEERVKENIKNVEDNFVKFNQTYEWNV